MGFLLSRKSHTAGSFYFNKQAAKKKKVHERNLRKTH